MNNWIKRFELESNEDNDILEYASYVAALVGDYVIMHICKEPRRTSEHTGHTWVYEILQGHPIHCYEMFRMEKFIFHKLCTELFEQGLKETKGMRVQEMVAIFLNMVGHGLGNRMLQERFQHLGETISRHIHEVLLACLKLSFKYIRPQDPMFRDCEVKIKSDQRY